MMIPERECPNVRPDPIILTPLFFAEEGEDVPLPK